MIAPHGCKRAAVFWDPCQGLREGKREKKAKGQRPSSRSLPNSLRDTLPVNFYRRVMPTWKAGELECLKLGTLSPEQNWGSVCKQGRRSSWLGKSLAISAPETKCPFSFLSL